MRGLLERLDEAPIEVVHGLRKLTKFIRALLVLDRTKPPLADEAMKQISAILAPYRDAQVNLYNFQVLITDHEGIASPKLARVLQENPFLLQTHPRDGQLEQLEQLLQSIGRDLKAEHGTPLDHGRILEGIQRSFEQARQIFSRLEPDSEMETVHKGRKRVKRLWYQLRFIFDDQEQAPEHIQSRFDILGSLLGEIHDLDMLLVQARELADPSFIRVLSEKRTTQLGLVLALGSPVFADTPASFITQQIMTRTPNLQ